MFYIFNMFIIFDIYTNVYAVILFLMLPIILYYNHHDPSSLTTTIYLQGASDKAALEQFLGDYFDAVGSDLDDWRPPDLQDSPAFLASIDNPELRQWAGDLNRLWEVLGRQVNKSVGENPQRHSFVPRNYPMIVPGGRFRESYYWDTWWIVRGLLVCDMTTTAELVIMNLLDDVENFGFVPNGGRIYYLDRSQPPLLSEMVQSLIDKLGAYSSNATRILARAVPLLEAEYRWWMDPSTGHVVVVDGHSLNRYHSNSSQPRPESYAEDAETAASAAGRDPGELYGEIRAAAESGWDFSSRWIAGSVPKSDVGSIGTSAIVPVELNSIMYRWEQNMARFASILGQDSVGSSFLHAAQARAVAVDAVLWQDGAGAGQGLWYDFNLSSARSVKADPDSAPSISQWVPLWAVGDILIY
jgi:alpha,alpha-trehalase